MPRKTPPPVRLFRRGTTGRFNEAAARCRGKLSEIVRGCAASPAASMRPRPDAAENPHRDRARAVGRAGASMRPRPDAAENRLHRAPVPAHG